MGPHRRLIWRVALAAAMLVPGWVLQSHAQSGAPHVGTIVALVDAQWQAADGVSKTRRTGTAWAAGHAKEEFFLVTAGHNVVDADSLREATSVEVRMVACKAPVPATVMLDTWSEDLDAVVLRARLSEDCLAKLSTTPAPRIALGKVADAMRGQAGLRVVLWGRKGQDVAASDGHLAGWKEQTLSIAEEMARGMSGGLVATKEGLLLGMIVKESAATEMDAIVKELETYNIPIDFVAPSGWLIIEGLLPSSAKLQIDYGPRIDVHERWRVPAGKHRLSLDVADHDQPDALHLDVDVDQEVRVCANIEPKISFFWKRTRYPLLAGSLAFLAGAGVTGALALKANSDFNNEPVGSSYDRTATFNFMTDVLLASGGLGLLLYGGGHLLWNAEDRSSFVPCK